MERETLKRIAVIGLPGSGKSTFAIRLGKTLGIPVHHLDKYVFDGKTKRDHQEFLAIKKALVNEKSWIIEGCSFSTLEMRFARADMMIYFHLPRWLCMWRVFKRPFTFDKTLADTGCLNGINWTLINYIWNFDRNKKEEIEAMRKRYPDCTFLTFHNSQDVDDWLDQFYLKSK